MSLQILTELGKMNPYVAILVVVIAFFIYLIGKKNLPQHYRLLIIGIIAILALVAMFFLAGPTEQKDARTITGDIVEGHKIGGDYIEGTKNVTNNHVQGISLKEYEEALERQRKAITQALKGEHGEERQALEEELSWLEQQLANSEQNYLNMQLLLDRLQTLHADDPKVQELRAEAALALARTDFDAVDSILIKAEKLDAQAIEDQERNLAARRQSQAQTLDRRAELAKLRYDSQKALSLYKEALALDNQDFGRLIETGRLELYSAGDVKAAQGYSEQALELAQGLGDQRRASVAHDDLGDALVRQGRFEAALQSYKSSLAIAQTLADQDPSNAQAQRDLSVSYNKIGDIEQSQGRLEEALQSYKSSLAIAQTLADQDPRNAEARRDLSVSYINIGDIEQRQGKLEAALQNYQSALAIAQTLADKDPKNAEAQRDLSISYSKIGNIERDQGRLEAALQNYKSALAIHQTLADQDPRNAETQRDLSISYDKIGNIEQSQGRLEEALQNYQNSLAIAQALADQDPSNAQAQRDLSISYIKIGNIEQSQGRLEEALQNYQSALAIRQTLADQDPSNAQAQRDLSLSYNKIGDIGHSQGRLEEALQSYQSALAIRQALARQDPSNAQARRDLVVSSVRMATAMPEKACEYLRQGLEILEHLQSEERLAPVDVQWIERIQNTLAELDCQEGAS